MVMMYDGVERDCWEQCDLDPDFAAADFAAAAAAADGTIATLRDALGERPL